MSFAPAELRKFSQAGEAISKAAGVAVEQWAEGEAGIILAGWVALINVQTVPAAEKRARNRALKNLHLTKGKVTINSGVRGAEGRQWIRTARGKWQLTGVVAHNAGAFEARKRHYSAEQWQAVQGAVADYQAEAGVIAMAKRTIGLARQSIVQIGDAIGIAIERVAGGTGLPAADIAKARAAVAGDGRAYQNGTGVRQRTDASFSLELINRYPKLHEAKIDIALATVVGRRIGYMGRVLNEKLLASTERTAKAFPYLQVNR